MNPSPHPAGAAGGATTPARKAAPPGASTGAPAPPIGGAFLASLTVLALAASVTLGQSRAGLGLAILGGGLAFTTYTAIPARDRFSTACTAAAAVLALTPAIRAAAWVQLIALAAALLLASIGAARASTWRELGAAVWAWLPGIVTAPVEVASQAVRRSATRHLGQLGPVVRGGILALVLLTIFGALFAAADAAFAHLVERLGSWQPSGDTVVDLLIFLAVVGIGGALRRVAVRRIDRPVRPATVALGRVEWTIALGSLVGLFAAFVALQLTTLFGGDDHVLRTAGLTYAQYARQGFGQLAVAAALTLLVVAAAARYGPAGDRIVRGLVGALGLLTLVLLASAIHRLGLYTDAYGATRLRFLVHVSLLWLGAVFVVVLAAGAVHRTAALPRALVLLTAATAIVFVAVNPDGRVAQTNVDLANTGHGVDRWYLSQLSVDAYPSLRRLPAQDARCIVGWNGPIARDRFVSLNLGRARARPLEQGLRTLPAKGC